MQDHIKYATSPSVQLDPEQTAIVTATQRLQQAINNARTALLESQQADGHWCFELEADCTIPAEYILMMHFMDEIDASLQSKMANYIRAKQANHGGWPLYTGGEFDISCSVKAYYALKLVGDRPNQPHMIKAREAILEYGGAARSNVFTRILLAMFQQVPWRAVPFIPAEILLLPRWFPFHINKMSYWSRTVLVPLSILYSLKATAKNPQRTDIRELFVTAPEREKHYFPIRSNLNRVILLLERGARLLEPVVPNWLRAYSIKKCMDWMIPRLNGEDGLGCIFPAMINAYEALRLFGYPADHIYCINAKRALERLLIIEAEQAYCQPCFSPVWDTALSALALQQANQATGKDNLADRQILQRGLDWLAACQVPPEAAGDWRERVKNPQIPCGGWAFQYRNDYYPDVDDTAAVGWAMLEIDAERYRINLDRAVSWVQAMQSKNGGFGAFDKNNTYYYLNEIPFADHGALLDPPSSDVSARCMAMLAHADYATVAKSTLTQCQQYLLREQEKNGAWYGRWGTNYIYGTWSVLSAFEIAGNVDQFAVKRAVKWLKDIQRSDGGWGESNDSYFGIERAGQADKSTAFQTAWALLALLAAGETHSEAVHRGIQYLLVKQAEDGFWYDDEFTAPGFPRVFYLKYHGYNKFFPLWALARYYNLLQK